MDNKDLFDAINIAAEDYIPDLMESTEGERPVILRAEKKPRSVKRIVFGAAACTAAAVVLGAAVTVGVKNYSQRGSLISFSSGSSVGNIERNFAPAEEILRIRDVGFYSKGMSSDTREYAECLYGQPMSKEELDKREGVFYAMNSIPPQPDIYYYNDIPLDKRMLSNEAYRFLSRYCALSEEDRAGETVPDEVKYLAGSGIIRFGDLGFLQDKYTERELEYYKACCYSGGNYRLYDSMMPPQPDVYYYDDIPYHLDRIGDEDTENWLKWFCWLDEGTQAQLGGYVPYELRKTFISHCYSEEPHIAYRGKVINFNSISEETQSFLRWYNLLPAELKGKVGYEPQELFPENLKKYPDIELPIELIGADGVPLTYKDFFEAVIYKKETGTKEGDNLLGYSIISFDEIEEWDDIRCYGFVYLAEPGSNEFKRYNVGDEINGLKITSACTIFRRFEGVSDPALYYAGGEVTFEGAANVDMLAVPREGGENGLRCAVSGLPVIDVDEQARAEGRIVPKPHSAEEFADNPDALLDAEGSRYFGKVTGDAAQIAMLAQNRGKIQKDVQIEEISMFWQGYGEYGEWYQVEAKLS